MILVVKRVSVVREERAIDLCTDTSTMRRANTWSDAGRLHGHSFLVPYKWGQSFGIFLDHHLPKILVCCVSAQGRVKGWGDEGGLHFFEDSPGFHSSGFRV